MLPGIVMSTPDFLLDLPKVKSPLGDLLRLGSPFPFGLDADDTDGGSFGLPLGGEAGFDGGGFSGAASGGSWFATAPCALDS